MRAANGFGAGPNWRADSRAARPTYWYRSRGRSNPEIAKDLSISRKTVSTHLEHIYSKLGISTRTEAALFAMQHGFTEQEAPA